MTDDDILMAEEMIAQTTFNEDSMELLIEDGEIENVCD